MARSRNPCNVPVSGALRSACAWRNDSQLPVRTPVILTPLTRRIPSASSGASNPLSAASVTSFRTADMRMMIDEDPSRRASNEKPAMR